MKDQKELLKKCLVNEIPAVVFQGTDSCALEILQAAEAIYKRKGCSPEFLIDFHNNVVENFKAYQQENITETKLPDLTTSEKEAFYILQEKEAACFPIQIKDFEQHLKDHGFIRTYESPISHGKYILSNEKDRIGITGNNGDYDFAIDFNKENNQMSYFVFSNDPQYPERIGDYNSLKMCFSDIMYNHPLQQKKSEIQTIINALGEKGYTDISKVLKQYSSAIDAISKSDNSKYTINNIQICNSKGKEMKGDITISPNNNEITWQLENLRILDKSTGKAEVLHIGDIDLNKQPIESIRKLLSGEKVEMTSKSGINSLVKLNKTMAGWGISAAKQIFNTADSSAGIY